MNTIDFNKLIDQFSNLWLNKKGVWGIEPRISGKTKNIVLYVNLDEIDYDKLPLQYKGYKTIIKPVEEFAALVK